MDKIKGARPSTAGVVCPFSGASALESTGDFIISSITTEVGGVGILVLGGILQRRSRKYSSQSSLDPTNIAPWLVLAYAPRRHKLATMQLLFLTTALSI